MSTAKSFEDLFVWQKSRELVNCIYSFTRKPLFANDRGLADQITRAAASVLSNIAEGFERGSREETVYFLYIAKASCGEVRAQLYVALDQKYITKTEFEKAADLCRFTSSLISKFIESLKVSPHKGIKFKKPIDKEREEFEKQLLSYLPTDHPLRNT
ncbi:four helix bundle protein [Candidatus Azambacteria bacterium]|nr:four helix bundle protein [Candidatus Azambacteria bacterium]